MSPTCTERVWAKSILSAVSSPMPRLCGGLQTYHRAAWRGFLLLVLTGHLLEGFLTRLEARLWYHCCCFRGHPADGRARHLVPQFIRESPHLLHLLTAAGLKVSPLGLSEGGQGLLVGFRAQPIGCHATPGGRSVVWIGGFQCRCTFGSDIDGNEGYPYSCTRVLGLVQLYVQCTRSTTTSNRCY